MSLRSLLTWARGVGAIKTPWRSRTEWEQRELCFSGVPGMAPATTIDRQWGAKGVSQQRLLPGKGKRKQPGVHNWASITSLQSPAKQRLASGECKSVGLLTGDQGGIRDMNGRCQPTTMRTRCDSFRLSRCRWSVEDSGEPETPLYSAWVLHRALPSHTETKMASGEKGEGRGESRRGLFRESAS